MISWNDNARDYIKRGKQQRAQEQQEVQERYDKDNKVFNRFAVVAIAVMVTLLVFNLPEMLDNWWYQQYELPAQQVDKPTP